MDLAFFIVSVTDYENGYPNEQNSTRGGAHRAAESAGIALVAARILPSDTEASTIGPDTSMWTPPRPMQWQGRR